MANKRTKPYHAIWDKVKDKGQAMVSVPDESGLARLKKALSNIKLDDVAYEYECIKKNGAASKLAYELSTETKQLRVYLKASKTKDTIDI